MGGAAVTLPSWVSSSLAAVCRPSVFSLRCTVALMISRWLFLMVSTLESMDLHHLIICSSRLPLTVCRSARLMTTSWSYSAASRVCLESDERAFFIVDTVVHFSMIWSSLSAMSEKAVRTFLWTRTADVSGSALSGEDDCDELGGAAEGDLGRVGGAVWERVLGCVVVCAAVVFAMGRELRVLVSVSGGLGPSPAVSAGLGIFSFGIDRFLFTYGF